MNQEQRYGDAVAWLLEADAANPGVRYFALRDLQDRPEEDAEVQAARRAVMASGPVPAILDAQYPEGYWVKPGGGYSPKYRGTVWQIIFLAELGADPQDERVRRGCAYVLEHSLAANGAFSANQQPVPSGAVHCLNGNLTAALVRLGWLEDPRVQQALDWQARAITGEPPIQFYRSGTDGPGFSCAVNLGQPCGWGAAKAMRALLSVPAAQRTPVMQRAVAEGVAFLLSRDSAVADYPYTERVSSTWFKLGFPLSYWSDVLEVAGLLVEAGASADPRLAGVLELIASKQGPGGRWKLENALTGKMWADIEAKGQPSKWITLRVLRLLKALMR